MNNFSERVDRGAKLLDQYHPGWYKKIDINELNMLCCGKCILGQCFRRYTNGLHALHLADFTDKHYPGLNDVEHGFDLVPCLERSTEEWDKLRELWIREIQFRLNLEAVIPNEELCAVE